MTIFTDSEVEQGRLGSSPRARMRMFQQMAEALEDEAAGLYRRAATYEEEEFLLNREIGERQTEINRLLFKLETMRSEHDGLLEKIESVKGEAMALREEAFTSEEEVALAVLDTASAKKNLEPIERKSKRNVSGEADGSMDSLYFRRMVLADAR